MSPQRSRLTDLVILDPITGKRENVGAIAKKRLIDHFSPGHDVSPAGEPWPAAEPKGDAGRLDGALDFWWIVATDARDDRVMKLGWHLDRREDCWASFESMTRDELDRLFLWDGEPTDA
jgi:hypothetical protein